MENAFKDNSNKRITGMPHRQSGGDLLEAQPRQIKSLPSQLRGTDLSFRLIPSLRIKKVDHLL